MTYKSDLLNLLSERGHLHQITDAGALDALAAKQVVTGYVGFDPTAPSLHIGNLASIMLLKRLQDAAILRELKEALSASCALMIAKAAHC
jgi:tyrosyl-tRNA synthetase